MKGGFLIAFLMVFTIGLSTASPPTLTDNLNFDCTELVKQEVDHEMIAVDFSTEIEVAYDYRPGPAFESNFCTSADCDADGYSGANDGIFSICTDIPASPTEHRVNMTAYKQMVAPMPLNRSN